MIEPVYNICCIGHITRDKVVNPGSVVNMPGGTAWYFSQAIARMPVNYGLVTAVGNDELIYADQLRHLNVDVTTLPCAHTVCFENSYGDNPDHREQRVLQKADSFTVAQLSGIHAKLFHLGPLLADDFEDGVIQHLAARSMVSLDVQGLLRSVEDTRVVPAHWPAKNKLLPYIHTLKVNEHELAVLTAQQDITTGAKILAGMGVKEVVITLGSEGSLIYADSVCHTIAACKPGIFKDATGCGDTYMAGYLYKRIQGASIPEAGHFASAMAGLKAGISGPFNGTEEEVNNFAPA
ncbi:MAG: PfkB family carbohydrate kinase [Mucilaginibacter sp.]